jgi:hypothetical protein
MPLVNWLRLGQVCKEQAVVVKAPMGLVKWVVETVLIMHMRPQVLQIPEEVEAVQELALTQEVGLAALAVLV